MSDQVRIGFNEIIEALRSLDKVEVVGVLEGPPTRSFPFKELVEILMTYPFTNVEKYRDLLILGIKTPSHTMVFHCKYNQIPDDFAVAFKGDVWDLLVEAASKLSRITKVTFTVILSAILHSIQGVYIDKTVEVYEIELEEVADRVVDWLPEFFQVTD